MAIKTIEENPRITDTIRFIITTPDIDGCFLTDPYKVDNIIIYFVERNFVSTNFGEYDKIIYKPDLLVQLQEAEKELCVSPTSQLQQTVERLRKELEETKTINKVYYKESKPIATFGDSLTPAWLSTDIDNALITKIDEDEDGNPLYGHFELQWTPNGQREGDYFICWTWTPNIAGSSLSAHLPFFISGDPRAVITIPTHLTPEEKYPTIFDRYLAEVYKMRLCQEDMTPTTLNKLNDVWSEYFTFLEDLSNQVIDLFDANALHESLLQYLSNEFALKLKSEDPTLWRRQIKRAVPVYKKKGTLPGLQEAYSQSGMELISLDQLWQNNSPYTWTDAFSVIDPDDITITTGGVMPLVSSNSVTSKLIFKLSKNLVPPGNYDILTLEILRTDSSVYEPLGFDNVDFIKDVENNITYMLWVGDQKSVSPIDLFVGDIIKITYPVRNIPNLVEQQNNDYILSLPLKDNRDETTIALPHNSKLTLATVATLNEMHMIEDLYASIDESLIKFPPKDFNTKLISESDPMFDVLIPVKHPFFDPVIFGFIRTEFPYSENIYNMEEYNGSTRPTEDPCFIDSDWVDNCRACLSSNFNISVQISELTNNRLLEAIDVFNEYTPFDAQISNIHFTGEFEDFMKPPVEKLDFLVTFKFNDLLISGNANRFFTRVIDRGLTINKVFRDQLASAELASSNTGTAYNGSVYLYSYDFDLRNLGINTNSNVLKVLAPSFNAGNYSIDLVDGKTGRVSGAVFEPLSQSEFTFELYNLIYSNTNTSVEQIDEFYFSDDNYDLLSLEIISNFDLNNEPSLATGPYKIKITSYSIIPYDIDNVLTNEKILIIDNGTLPIVNTTGITYELLDDLGQVVYSSSNGRLTVVRKGLVNINDGNIPDVQESNYFQLNDVVNISGNDYVLSSFDSDTSKFYIFNYSSGDAGGLTVTINRFLRKGVGSFHYQGLYLQSTVNEEIYLGVQNGANGLDEDSWLDDDTFKQNYLIEIDGNYYKMSEIDNNIITLAGLDQDWMTLTAGGTVVNYNIYRFTKNTVFILDQEFDGIDRDGDDHVEFEIETMMPMAMSMHSDSAIKDSVKVNESLFFAIEHIDGNKIKGKL